MAKKTFYQYNPYLDDWKREMDDESLNKKVLDVLSKYKNRFKRVLDIGTGSGVQIRRNIESGLLKDNAEIIGMDINREGLINSIDSFRRWAKKKHYNLIYEKSRFIHKFKIIKGTNKYFVELREDSVYDLIKNKRELGSFDFISGLSLFEHTKMETALKNIYAIMKKGGLLYLPINYDLHTVFGPTKKDKIEKELALMRLFNYVAIDSQFKGGVNFGNSQCGSLLPQLCKNANLEILAYGASEWVIPPNKAIKWTSNKKHILDFFVNIFYKIFKETDKEIMEKFYISSTDIEKWYKLRKNQFKNGTLYFSCMNKDILCKKS